MANEDRPNGFRAATCRPKIDQLKAAASQTIAVGDIVFLNDSGRACIGVSDTAAVCGVAAGSVTASAAGDAIQVYVDPYQIYEAQCSGTGTGVTAIYTTSASGACYDTEGTTGIMEINEDAHAMDMIKVVGIGRDPGTGQISADGLYQRFFVMINPAKNQMLPK